MGAIGGLYAIAAIYELVQDKRRDERVTKALRTRGTGEDAIKGVIGAFAYVQLSPKEKGKMWKDKTGEENPPLRAERENGVNGIVTTMLRDPEIRHAYVNNPKREAEIAKSLEDEETQFSERLNRLEAALRGQGKDEASIGAFKAALVYDSLSPGGRDQMWEMSPMPKTPEARAQFDGDVQVLLTSVMYHPDLRHAWLNDAQREAEIAKYISTMAGSG